MSTTTIIKRIGLSILFTLATNLSFAGDFSDGGSGTGGGDPLANQFLILGRFFQFNQKTNPIDGVDVSSEKLENQLNYFERSLEGLNPQIIFPAGKLPTVLVLRNLDVLLMVKLR